MDSYGSQPGIENPHTGAGRLLEIHEMGGGLLDLRALLIPLDAPLVRLERLAERLRHLWMAHSVRARASLNEAPGDGSA